MYSVLYVIYLYNIEILFYTILYMCVCIYPHRVWGKEYNYYNWRNEL